ncbi:MAG TPA: L,D-transpeptidase family protein [Terriglobia bacterium]|nr:L,D-transpeptidase family protein [Terriglobia bacterium]
MLIGAVVAGVAVVAILIRSPLFDRIRLNVPERATVGDRVASYGPAARARLGPFFRSAGVSYPPERFVLAAFKREEELHLFAAGPSQKLTFVRRYPVLAASGRLGPKLQEGDRQVPEGVYEIESLNPNSQFHLSLRLNYPNEDDRRHANDEGRTDLGGDIMIHGDTVSIGCLAMGDAVAEELFVLAADAGWQGARVIVSPVDFRRSSLPQGFRVPAPWVRDLYRELRLELSTLPLPRT